MTIEELAKLTPEQKRIRIAELQGWTEVKHSLGVIPGGSGVNYIPDYLSDLNAMHEAEKLLQTDDTTTLGQLWELYVENLSTYKWKAVCATAAQRANAFLLVVG